MKKFTVIIILISLMACTAQHKSTGSAVVTSSSIVTGGKLFTAFYQQQAAEYSALCMQAYNIARLRLDMALPQPTEKPFAIVTDIDETVLNNSPYAVHQALQGKDYDSKSWAEWTSLAQCDTLAGSASFFNYAATKNVEIFYITNRREQERQGTFNNLQKYHFPSVDSVHLIMKTGAGNSKESRIRSVAARYNIVLFLGDNLSDFGELFDDKSVSERLQNARSSSSQFGNKFIVLPNPDYGDWENSTYQYNYHLTISQKDSIIKSVLKNY